MGKLFLRKFVEMVVVMFFVTLIVFFTFRLLPGDPVQMRLGLNPTPEAVQALTKDMGLDRPLLVQYFSWLTNMFHGDLGKSALDSKPVVPLLEQKLPITFELALVGYILSLLIAVPVGVFSTIYKNSWLDRLARTISLFGFSTPSYFLAILLMLMFAYKIHLFPAGGYVSFLDSPWGHIKSMILPAFSIGIINAGQMFRFIRSGMLEVIGQDYIRTARAKGISEMLVIGKHVARNALSSLVTVTALNFSITLSGMVVTEQIFAWPGVGWLLIQSILARDYDVVQGAVLVSAAIVVVINLLGDVVNALLDPRIKYD